MACDLHLLVTGEESCWAGKTFGTPQTASDPVQTVDVGCGIGGSSRHIAAKYGSSGKGITLSPVQVQAPRLVTAVVWRGGGAVMHRNIG